MTTLTTRGLWSAITFMFSLIAGLVGGALTSLSGDNPAKAIIAGFAAFGATMGLVLLLITFLSPAPAPPRSDDNNK